MSLSRVAKFIWTHPGNRNKRWRQLGKGLRWQIWKRITHRPKLITLANGARFSAHPDCVVSSSLQYADWPEYHEIIFCRTQLRHGDIVVDVGANVGHFALLVSEVVGAENVICFEPMPVAYDRLRANFQQNGWTTANLHHAAVGAQKGSIEFPDPPKPDTTSSAVWTSPNVRRTTVPMVSLDGFFDENSYTRLDCLKMDVEGFEEQVFCGAAKVLRLLRPRLVMFESLKGELEEGIREVLRECDYIVFQLDAGGAIQLDNVDAQNLFASPVEIMSTLES